MAKTKRVIGRDGQLKTVVKVKRSRSERVQQHSDGRGRSFYADSKPMAHLDLKQVAWTFLSVLVLLALLLWGLFWLLR